jgi:hypothetical protein
VSRVFSSTRVSEPSFEPVTQKTPSERTIPLAPSPTSVVLSWVPIVAS